MIKKHLKPTKQNKGGIIQKENYYIFQMLKILTKKLNLKKVIKNNDTKT